MKKLSLFCAALFCTATMSAALNFDPQGGTLATAPADNAALWEELKPAYNTYYKASRGDQTLSGNGVATFMEKAQAMMTDELSGWKWLGDLIIKTTTDQGTSLSSEAFWRYNVQSFLQASVRTGWPASADYSVNGTKAVWESGYIFGNAPTNGDRVFGGWYTEPACVNQVANWTEVADGTTLYAKWTGESGIESITWGTVSPVASGKTVEFLPTVAPAGATEAYTCSSSDSTVAVATVTAHGVAVKGIKGGTATITLHFAAGTSAQEITVTEPFAIELNGGELSIPGSNEELWNQFKPYYKEFYGEDRGDQSLDGNGVAGFMTQGQKIMTDASSAYKWLGDYIILHAPEMSEITDETTWRYTVQAFFKHNAAYWAQKGDWSENGCLGLWKPYYVLGNTPEKSGYNFTGWFLDADCTQAADAAALPAEGTLYAGWEYNPIVSIEIPEIPAIVAPAEVNVAITINPATSGEKYICASSDSTVAIATVTDGGFSIKAIKAGTATITLTYAAGSSSQEVTVTEAFAIELNGGMLAQPESNVDLWEAFKPDYNAWYAAHIPADYGSDTWSERGKWTEISAVATFAHKYAKDFLTNAESAWKWLGDYLHLNAPELDGAASEATWRWTLSGFFNCQAIVPNGGLGSWSDKGCLGAWRPYYVLAQTPEKAGYIFKGWFLDAACTIAANPATLPASGTIYASFAADTATGLENAEVNQAKVVKVIENGQVIIIRDGVKYNTLGAIVK